MCAALAHILGARRILHTQSSSLPVFKSLADLVKAKAWYKYLFAMYGEGLRGANKTHGSKDNLAFPLDLQSFDYFDLDVLEKAAATVPGKQKTSSDPLEPGDLFTRSRLPGRLFRYRPRHDAVPNNTQVEVLHCLEDGGERVEPAYWMYHSRGTGMFYDVGKTIAFYDHKALCKWIGPECKEVVDEYLHSGFLKLREQGYDSLQFTNYDEPAPGTEQKHNFKFELVDLRGIAPADTKSYVCPLAKAAFYDPEGNKCACEPEHKRQCVNCGSGKWPTSKEPTAHEDNAGKMKKAVTSAISSRGVRRHRYWRHGKKSHGKYHNKLKKEKEKEKTNYNSFGGLPVDKGAQELDEFAGFERRFA